MDRAQQPEGTIYIESFSGFVLISEEAFKTVHLRRSNFDLTFYSPLRLANPTWRPIPQLTDENLQTVFPGAPKQPVLRMAVLPTLGDDGLPALMPVWGEDGARTKLHADTFPIMVAGKGHSERGAHVAHNALRDTFVWLRILTKQWWIGRPTEAITGNLHFIVPMSTGGRVTDKPYPFGSQVSPNIGTQRVTFELWESVLKRVARAEKPKIADILLSDASYFYFAKEYLTALILACSMAEIERDRIVETNTLSKQDLRAAPTDLLKHLSSGLDGCIGRDLKREDPDSYEFLKACWIARGNVAHGKPLLWVLNGKKNNFDDLKGEFSTGLNKLLTWLRTVG